MALARWCWTAPRSSRPPTRSAAEQRACSTRGPSGRTCWARCSSCGPGGRPRRAPCGARRGQLLLRQVTGRRAQEVQDRALLPASPLPPRCRRLPLNLQVPALPGRLLRGGRLAAGRLPLEAGPGAGRAPAGAPQQARAELQLWGGRARRRWPPGSWQAPLACLLISLPLRTTCHHHRTPSLPAACGATGAPMGWACLSTCF